MKERPILFSAPMVRAILEGGKTQTRRLVKIRGCAPGAVLPVEFPCPYGVVGDRLWVKETWRSSRAADKHSPAALTGHGWPVWYVADGGVMWTGADRGGPGFMTPGKTRVSIHMPRWASRITLEVTDVRVERLQDITEADARAEGVQPLQMDNGSALPSFEGLWCSINGAGSWAANPWVWAISFARVGGGAA